MKDLGNQMPNLPPPQRYKIVHLEDEKGFYWSVAEVLAGFRFETSDQAYDAMQHLEWDEPHRFMIAGK